MAPEKGSELAEWEAEVDDVFVPAVARASFTKAQGGLPTTAAAGSARAASTVGRRMSSLGSLHPHAGHTSWPIATGHLITAIIGAGVLGLPNAVAWLGWIAGMVCVCVFYAITLWTCTMLTDCYHVKGKRHTRYKWAVLHIMGPRHAVLLSLCQHLNMILTTIGYHIAAADSMHYITKLACKTMGRTDCPLPGQWQHTIIFGALQLIMSQLPNLESVWWVSAIGALMSIGYSVLAVVLGATQAHNRDGTFGGRVAPPIDKIFGIFNSLGNIGFAYSSAIVLMEIEDTLREPPRAAVSMKKTVMAGLGVTFFFYLLVVVLGYMALGNAVPDNVLLGFHQSPSWVNMLANAMVLVHMISAYQLYAQPVFQTIEDMIIGCVPRLAFAPRSHEVPLRLVYRSLYVAFTTFIASLLPFFGAFTGLVGAVTFFPTAVAYPILMYMRITPDIPGWRKGLMWAVFGGMGLVALVATAGSLESIVHTASSFKLFGGRDA